MNTKSTVAVSLPACDSELPLHEALPACFAGSAEQILREELEAAALSMEQHQRVLSNDHLQDKAQVLRETNNAIALAGSLQGELARQAQCMTGAKLPVGIDGQTALLELLAATTASPVTAGHLTSVAAFQEPPSIWASWTQPAIEASSASFDCSTGLDHLLDSLRKLRMQPPHT